ncbi:MAG: hypothetical protein WCF18_19215 [Chthoniobacteraceae bacterium]
MVWLSLALLGTAAMLAYANVPGVAAAAPGDWPPASEVPRAAGRPTLVMFLHPQCPCSRASIGELALLLAHAPRAVEARVLFLDPEGDDEAWVETDLWRSAAAIPGVAVARDVAGREARVFHSGTSGATLLYDGAGRLLFQGGITLARGHAGDNPGRSAIEALLRGEEPPTAATPVFGCGLFAGLRTNPTSWKR